MDVQQIQNEPQKTPQANRLIWATPEFSQDENQTSLLNRLIHQPNNISFTQKVKRINNYNQKLIISHSINDWDKYLAETLVDQTEDYLFIVNCLNKLQHLYSYAALMRLPNVIGHKQRQADSYIKDVQVLTEKIKTNKDPQLEKYLYSVHQYQDIKSQLAQKNVQITTLENSLEQNQKVLQQTKDQKEKLQQDLNEVESKIIATKEIKGKLHLQIQEEKKELEHFQEKKKKLEGFYSMLLDEIRLKHNKIQNKKGNIRVYLRIKPLSIEEGSIIQIQNQKKLTLKVPEKFIKSQNQIKQYDYAFENVFGPSSTQEEIFEELKPLLLNVVDGFNVCIFAYGPTGTGKTFTMMGDGSMNNRGLAPWMLERIFYLSKKILADGIQSSLSMEMFEVYNEKIRGLIDIDEGEEIQSHWIGNVKEAFDYLQKALDQRITKKTAKNQDSSRSHLVFKLHINCKNMVTGSHHQGTLVLADLAGSERVDESKTSNDTLKETQAINKSLSSLGEVMNALYSKSQYIPFRNSKLTMLLQEYLVNDAKAMMIVNLSSGENDYQQTAQSLKFANQVKSVEGLNKYNK